MAAEKKTIQIKDLDEIIDYLLTSDVNNDRVVRMDYTKGRADAFLDIKLFLSKYKLGEFDKKN
jgi:DNA polymerase II large subunit